MLTIGVILDLLGRSGVILLNGLKYILITGLLSIPLCIPFALVASITRGYLLSVGCNFLILVLIQVFGTLGHGQYFPWSILALYSGAAEVLTGITTLPLGIISYILVGLVGVISLVITGAWWCYADQT